MIFPVLYYLILPFVGAALVLRFLKRYGKHETPADLALLFRESPLEKKWYRAARRDGRGLTILGDFETQDEATDAAYAAAFAARKAREKAAFLTLNDKAEVLREIDA